MLFNFKIFIEELRLNSEKKIIIEEYEKYYGKITGDIKNQNWYIDYVSKFSNFYEVVNSPKEIEAEFDWQLLFSLIVSSNHSEYKLIKPNKIIFEINQKVDLEITVSYDENTVVKRVDELWSFQVMRLFEIYVEEQIKLQTLIATNDVMIEIYKIRCQKIEYIKNYKHNLIKNESKIDVYNNLIYHYTNFDSFYNLLNSKTIWACDLKKLNDKKEYQIWFEVFDQAYMNIKNKEDSKDYLEIIEEIYKNVNSYKKLDCYVSCFTAERDLLSQWRAYGDDGKGIAIAFDSQVLMNDLFKKNDPNNEFKLLYGPLEYNYINVYIDVLTKYEEIILDFNKSLLDFKSYINQVDKLKLINDISKSIYMRIQDLKDSSFFEEKEFRVFWQEEKSSSLKNIKKFQKGNVFIPYVELLFEEVIPIKEIIIGPTVADKEFCKQNIIDALKYHGYDTDKIIIEDSKIPYRK